MGNQNTEAVKVDKKTVEAAHQGWVGFTKLMTYSTVAVLVIVALMAIFLV